VGRPRVSGFRFETFRGRLSLRYATARVLTADCTGCLNQDPNSIRRDWRIRDVGGVLEIILPLDGDTARTHEGLRGTFLWIALVSGALLPLSVLVLVAWSRRSA
jgi:hypothetical protein